MTKKFTEKNRYKRITCEGYCAFEDYIAEWLVLRWTNAFKMEKPGYEFWKVPGVYRERYHRNMKAAQGLLKKYDAALIFAALRSDHFKNIYHIGLKAYGPRGWKYNPLAVEAVKRYNKEFKQSLKLAKKAEKQKQKELDYEPKKEKQEKTKTRNKTYKPTGPQRKITLKQLRDMQ